MLKYGDKMYLTYEETSQVLNATVRHVYNLINEGELHSVKIGRSRRKFITLEEVQKFVPELDIKEFLSKPTTEIISSIDSDTVASIIAGTIDDLIKRGIRVNFPSAIAR